MATFLFLSRGAHLLVKKEEREKEAWTAMFIFIVQVKKK